MKRRLLRMANGLVKPLGVQFYRSGMDMESVIGQIGRRDGAIGTVLDIGASDGKWSRAAMRHLRDSRFIAVDPLSERENMLRRLKNSFLCALVVATFTSRQFRRTNSWISARIQ